METRLGFIVGGRGGGEDVGAGGWGGGIVKDAKECRRVENFSCCTTFKPKG